MPVTEQLHPALLAFLKNQPKRMLIDGKWVEAASGKTFETVNPATGERLLTPAEAQAARRVAEAEVERLRAALARLRGETRSS